MNYKEIEMEMAKTYDGIFDKYIAEARDDWADKIYVNKFLKYLNPGATILDIGCGTGELLEYYDTQGFITMGIDISKNMVKTAEPRIKNKDSKVEKMSLYDIEKIDKQFDAVSATFIFVHVPKMQMKKVLNDIKDKLKQNGVLFVAYTKFAKEGLQEEPLDNNYKFYAINHDVSEFKKIFLENGMEILDYFVDNKKVKYPKEILIVKKI